MSKLLWGLCLAGAATLTFAAPCPGAVPDLSGKATGWVHVASKGGCNVHVSGPTELTLTNERGDQAVFVETGVPGRWTFRSTTGGWSTDGMTVVLIESSDAYILHFSHGGWSDQWVRPK